MRLACVRSVLAAALLGGTALFAACVPNPVNTEVKNALVAKPDTLRLLRIDTSAQTVVALNCGCTYKLGFRAIGGDSASISYTPAEPLDSMATPHRITFRPVAGASSGTHTVQYSLSTYDDDTRGYFYDTVTVILNVP